MATKQGVSSINLLPKDSFEFSTTGKLLKWITTAGRVLVVLTEFVVLLAFGSRFYFDKKLDDLGEVIVQKQAQVMTYSEIETDIRKILAKQRQVEIYEKSGLGFSEKINSLTNILPAGTSLDSFNLNNGLLVIEGKAQSEYGFAQFLTGIKKMPGVAMINMKDTNFDQTTGGVKFNIQISYK